MFSAAFDTEPQPDAHPGCLVTLDDLKAKCRELGEAVSGTKAELAKRIKAKDASNPRTRNAAGKARACFADRAETRGVRPWCG